MSDTRDEGLRILREASELAPTIRIELTPEYLQLVAAVEALPQNRSGATKSARWLGSLAYWRNMSRGENLRSRR